MGPTEVMKVPLNVFFKNPESCIRRSEIHVLVFVNDVWNSKVDKECPGEAFYCVLSMYRDMLPWFTFCVYWTRDSQNDLLQRGNSLRVCKSVQLGPFAGHDIQCEDDFLKFGQLWHLGSVLYQGHPGQGMESSYIPPSSITYHLFSIWIPIAVLLLNLKGPLR